MVLALSTSTEVSLNVVAEKLDAFGIGDGDTAHRLNCGGFAGAVRIEEAKYLAMVIDRLRSITAFADGVPHH